MRIVIAEDEMLERKAMRKFLVDNFQQIEVVGEAINGRKAIELADSLLPDVMLVDIKMPGINGLEAIEEIHSKHPSIKFILVSAYDSFNYAKQAMHLGVKEYILKPSKKEETIRAILRIKAEIEKESALEAHREHSIEIARELFITKLMQFDHGEDLQWLSQELFPNMVSGFFLACAGKFTFDKEVKKQLEQEARMTIISIEEESYLFLLFIAERQLGKPEILKQSRLLQMKLGEGSFVGAGYSYEQPDDLSKSFFEAKSAAKSFFEMKRSTFGFPLEEEKSIFPIEDIIKRISSGQEKSAVYLFHEAWEQNLAIPSQTLHELYFNIKQLLESENIHASVQPIDDLNTKNDWVSFIQHASLEILYHFQSQDKIARAKKYIDENYTGLVSLEGVAQLIDLSPSYFSNLFKDTVGETFVDYLTNLRMKKAEKLLLENRYNLKEISYMVGYKDPNYFSRVFKKSYSMSPKSYQKTILKK